MANLNALAHEIRVGDVIPNLSALAPVLELQPLPLANTPPATGTISVPQAPSGSVTGQAATFNYTNTITSTKEYLTNVLEVDSAQQGTNAISNVASITSSFAGVDPKLLMVNNYTAGSVGTSGNKFS